ncbi:MAG: GntR family transcriptional regulator [Acidobacteriaceae bacterium]|nr:GntR family transcriptional regulator [Acidobacteriaceae bacterium]
MTTIQEDRAIAELAWLANTMLSYGPLIPDSLAVMLRAYKAELQQPREKWGAFGPPHRYGEIAELIEQRIKDGEWAPGTRIPSADVFAETYGSSGRTAARAIHMLALKGVLVFERRAYYVT